MHPTVEQLLRVAGLITLTAETVRMFVEEKTHVDGQGDRLLEVSHRLEENASEIVFLAKQIDQKTA